MTKILPQRVRAHLARRTWLDVPAPSWLASPYDTPQWRVVLQPHENPDRYPGAPEKILDWNHTLPWGLSLLDNELTELRDQCRRVMIRVADTGEINSYPIETVPPFFNLLTSLLEHLVFADKTRILRLGLGALGVAQVESYMERYGSGGTALAGYWAERMDLFLRENITDAFAVKAPGLFDAFGLPIYSKTEIASLKIQLISDALYREDGALSNHFIARAIGIPPKRLKCVKHNAFAGYLGQFRLTARPSSTSDMTAGDPTSSATLPSVAFANTAGRFIRRLQRICRDDARLASLAFAQMDLDPYLAVSRPSRPLVRTMSRTDGEMLPVLRQAILFVEDFGDPILSAIQISTAADIRSTSDTESMRSIEGLTSGSRLDLDSVSRTSSRQFSDAARTASPTAAMGLFGALDILIGCALFITLTLSCSRLSEIITLLKTDLLRGKSGAHIRIHVRKTFAIMEKPVPDCAFDALSLISKVSTTLVSERKFTDTRVMRRVFTRCGTARVGRFDRDDAYECLRSMWQHFAPRNGISPMDLIKPHQCRRFFAMSFFHSGGEASLPALSWFMGHERLVDTWHYIREDMTGAEITELEAEMARNAITSSTLDANAQILRNVVLRHFGATSITLVDPHDIQAYLEILRGQNRFEVVPIEVPIVDGRRCHVLTLTVAANEDA